MDCAQTFYQVGVHMYCSTLVLGLGLTLGKTALTPQVIVIIPFLRRGDD